MALVERKEPYQPLKKIWKEMGIRGNKFLELCGKLGLLRSERRDGTSLMERKEPCHAIKEE